MQTDLFAVVNVQKDIIIYQMAPVIVSHVAVTILWARICSATQLVPQDLLPTPHITVSPVLSVEGLPSASVTK
jgi:hypothetical protein